MRVLAFDVGTRTLSFCALDVQPKQTNTGGGDTAAAASVPRKRRGNTAGATPKRFNIQVLAWETVDIHADAPDAPQATASAPPPRRQTTTLKPKPKPKPTMKQDAEAVIRVLNKRKDGLVGGLGVEAVLIEQQPAGGSNRFSSVRMKCLSHVIHAFFYGHAVQHHFVGAGSGGEHGENADPQRRQRVPVDFVSPASKLSVPVYGLIKEAVQTTLQKKQPRTTQHPPLDPPPTTTGNIATSSPTNNTASPSPSASSRRAMGAQYRKNKQHAVRATTALLQDMEDTEATRRAWTVFRNAAPKQDDLSDCFMLAYAFAYKHVVDAP